jgi:hypothetical protein
LSADGMCVAGVSAIFSARRFLIASSKLLIYPYTNG